MLLGRGDLQSLGGRFAEEGEGEPLPCSLQTTPPFSQLPSTRSLNIWGLQRTAAPTLHSAPNDPYPHLMLLSFSL